MSNRVQVFEVRGGAASTGGVPRLHLEPPHYDGVQCLALSEDTLFSGSRDTSIKRWHLSSQDAPHVRYTTTFLTACAGIGGVQHGLRAVPAAGDMLSPPPYNFYTLTI